MLIACTYLGGHPDHPASIQVAELKILSLDLEVSRVEVDRGTTMGLAIASKKGARTSIVTIASDEIIALEADQTRSGLSIPIGGLVAVSDDFALGGGGVIRTEGEGTLTLLVQREGQRYLVAFTAGTAAVMAFAYAYQLARVKAARGTLPGLFELDHQLRAARQAQVQEEILVALRELVSRDA